MRRPHSVDEAVEKRTRAGYTRGMFEFRWLRAIPLGRVGAWACLVLACGCEDPRKYGEPLDAAISEDASDLDARPVEASRSDSASNDTTSGGTLSEGLDASTVGITLTGSETWTEDATATTSSGDSGSNTYVTTATSEVFSSSGTETSVITSATTVDVTTDSADSDASSSNDAGPSDDSSGASSSNDSSSTSSSNDSEAPATDSTASECTTCSDAGPACADGGCDDCGANAQACCPDDECDPGLECDDGTCVPLLSDSLVLNVSGLDGVLVLALNDETLPITTNGDNTIELELELGETLLLSIDTDPLNQRCLLDGETEFEDQYAGDSYSIDVVCEDDVADLQALTSSVAGLSFSRDTLLYELNAPFSCYSITLTATPEQDTATVSIDGDVVAAGEEVTLALPTGLRTIPVEVQAESGLSRTYELEVRRAAELEFVQRLVSEEAESYGFGADIDVDGDEFAVLTSGTVSAFLGAVTLFDFDSLEPVRHFGSLNPADYFSPRVAFDAGHLLFTNADYISMSVWTARDWDSPLSLSRVMDPTQLGNAMRFAGDVSGDTLVIGGIWTQIVYTLVDGEWQEQQRLYPLHGTEVEVDYELYANPLFVELSGDTLVVAGQVTSMGPDDPESVVRIYQRQNGEFSLALSPEVVPEAVAVGENVVAIGDTNSTHIYELADDTWTFQRDVFTNRTRAIHGPYLVSTSGTNVTVNSWNPAVSTASSTVSVDDTDAEEPCGGYGSGVAMNENGLLVGGCNSVFVFR